jgi:hypothetical protein
LDPSATQGALHEQRTRTITRLNQRLQIALRSLYNVAHGTTQALHYCAAAIKGPQRSLII